MTRTGSPLAPAFSFLHPVLRYTVEPGPPGGEAGLRLGRVLSLLRHLNVDMPPSRLLARIVSLQQKGPLKYGAHVGARHTPRGDLYKLYVELPREAAGDAEELGERLLHSPPVLKVPGRDPYPTIVGIELTKPAKTELYYRVENLHTLEIGTLMERAGLVDRAAETRKMLEESVRRRIRHELPGSTWGFSYSAGSSGRMTFSLYTFARTLFGPDGPTREAVLRLGRNHGWDLTSYERISRPLHARWDVSSLHGIFGLVVSPGRPPAAWIDLAPPPPEQDP